MISKLTLSVPEASIRNGKKMASLRGVSLSKLVSDFLANLEDEAQLPRGIDKRVGSMAGRYKLMRGETWEECRLLSLLSQLDRAK